MYYNKFCKYSILILFIFAACTRIDLFWDLNKLPQVETSVTTFIDISATVGGNVIDNGGTAILERGVCYDKNPSPTTLMNIAKSGTGDGVFFINLTGLTPNTIYYLRAYATNKVGTAYGSEIKFSTKGVPSLKTSSVTSIKASNAVSGGTITSDGGASVTSKGLCWGTSPNPTIVNSKTLNGTGTGSFTSSIPGLTANTTYYVRAYAINFFGTGYGDQLSFITSINPSVPVISTSTISGITSVSAISGGNITDEGGASVSARGVCWNTSTTPTIANSKTADGTGMGIFTSSIPGLTSYTTYYVRAYATNSAGTAYGNQLTFTTSAGLATLTTTAISAITTSTATGGGNISNSGGATVTARGICYSTSPNPTISNSIVLSGTGTGTFTSNLTGLLSNTSYYVRAYATNSSGTGYGNEVTFRTSIIVSPSLSTTTITSITPTSAITGGNVTSDGGSAVTARGVCYSTVTNPTISNSIVASGSGVGTFTSSITGLSSNTIYYVRAYATNSAGTAYGTQVSFTTLPYSIGLSYGGGVIFYVDGTGQHGLISATTNQTSSFWGCSGTTLTGCNGITVGMGQSNTTAIVNGCSTSGIAARICYDLVLNTYSDWYLPSSDELNLMYLQRNLIGGFTTGSYCSSTQVSSTSATIQTFSTGLQSSGIKTNSYYVRAIRTF